MSWNHAAVTNAGVALLNESLAGHILTITSAVGGAGTLEDQELASAVDVVDQKQIFSLMGLEDLEQGKQVGIQVSNKGISESYILHQIGVKARLEYEDEETLLLLLQDDRGVEIPSEAENPDFLFEVYATIAISNKANITINVNPNVIASVKYVKAELQKKADQDFSNLTDPQTALYNLGAGVRPNLLINGLFMIDQRSNGPYQNKYGPDGWITFENATATFDNPGVTLTPGEATNGGMNQFLEPIDSGMFTLSALFDNGDICWAVYAVSENGQSIEQRYMHKGNTIGAFTLGYSADTAKNYVQFRVNKQTKFLGAKLEPGEGQTLAYQDSDGNWKLLPQPGMDLGTQLTNCQALFCKSAKNNLSQLGGFIAAVQPGSTEWLNLSARFPVQMRKNKPTVTFTWLSKTTDITKNILDDSVTLIPGAISESGFSLIYVLGLALEPESLYLVQFEASAE